MRENGWRLKSKSLQNLKLEVLSFKDIKSQLPSASQYIFMHVMGLISNSLFAKTLSYSETLSPEKPFHFVSFFREKTRVGGIFHSLNKIVQAFMESSMFLINCYTLF